MEFETEEGEVAPVMITGASLTCQPVQKNMTENYVEISCHFEKDGNILEVELLPEDFEIVDQDGNDLMLDFTMQGKGNFIIKTSMTELGDIEISLKSIQGSKADDSDVEVMSILIVSEDLASTPEVIEVEQEQEEPEPEEPEQEQEEPVPSLQDPGEVPSEQDQQNTEIPLEEEARQADLVLSVNVLNLNSDEEVSLQLSFGQDQSELLKINSNGMHSFAHLFADQDQYSVSINTQALNQSCFVRSGSGSFASSDINLQVECATHTIINGTWTWDVETNSLGSGQTDFWWQQETSTVRSLVPSNGALAALETIEAFENIDLSFVQNASLFSTQLSGSDVDPELVPGSVVLFRTAEGRYGKLQVIEYLPLEGSEVKNYHLKVAWRLFETSTSDVQVILSE